MNDMKKKVLIVGAGGFMGSHFAEAALQRGWEVTAGVRQLTSRKYLRDERLRFAVFDFDNPDTLADTLRQNSPEGGWDYIIYNLGATKALRFEDFNRINYQYLRSFLEALKAVDKEPERFLYMSSLSVLGKGDEKGYAPFTEESPAIPDTRYGASKLKAEMEVIMSGVPYIIFRPTGIYGPRDHDYFLMLESLQKGFSFGAGYRRQLLTFIYGPDLAQAALEALLKAPANSTYLLSEERCYTQKEYRRMAAGALGKKHVCSITVPLWGVKIVSVIAQKIGAARGKPSTLNSDKYNIMRQRNWRVDTTAAQRDFGFTAPTSLEQGLRQTVEWCRQAGWLKK